MKFNHVGIPTTARFDGEIPLPDLQMTVSDHQDNPFGIQWQLYWEDAPYPELVKSIPHVAFEVDDLEDALQGHHIIIEPNSPSLVCAVMVWITRQPDHPIADASDTSRRRTQRSFTCATGRIASGDLFPVRQDPYAEPACRILECTRWPKRMSSV